jgi:fructokinase
MRIGVDLGGTKIEAIALADDGATLLRRRVPTPVGDYRGTVNAVRDLVLSFEQELSRSATVGIATPGAISPRSGLMKNSNSVVINGKPLDHDLVEALARPVRLENDANCFALSEAVDGAAARAHLVFGVILGTGVGGGVVIGQQLISGPNRIAGEWGHNPLPWPQDTERPGRACYCGKAGCIETFLSGPNFARDFRERSGRDLAGPEIVRAAEAGDKAATDCLEAYKDRLARSLATVINIIDPDTIVLGGGMSNVVALYDGLQPLIQRYVFSDGVDTPVLRAVHGDSSGVRGAAWLWSKEGLWPKEAN